MMVDIGKCLNEGGVYLDLDVLEMRLFFSKLKKDASSKELSQTGFLKGLKDLISPVDSFYFDNMEGVDFKVEKKDFRGGDWFYPGVDRRVFTLVVPSQRKSEVVVVSRNALFDVSGEILGYTEEREFLVTEGRGVFVMSNLYGLELCVREDVSLIEISSR